MARDGIEPPTQGFSVGCGKLESQGKENVEEPESGGNQWKQSAESLPSYLYTINILPALHKSTKREETHH